MRNKKLIALDCFKHGNGDFERLETNGNASEITGPEFGVEIARSVWKDIPAAADKTNTD